LRGKIIADARENAKGQWRMASVAQAGFGGGKGVRSS